MRRVTIASGSQPSADAGASIADAGGNAVDAAVGAAIMLMCTDPGIIAPGAGGFVTVWHDGQDPMVVDGYCSVPGKGIDDRRRTGGDEVHLGYGGGMTTSVGYGSIAVPGAFAALGDASERFGDLPWSALLEPTIETVELGFPLSRAAGEYFGYSHSAIFGWQDESHGVIHRDDGTPLRAGDTVRIPHLGSSLRAIAANGASEFYRGDLGRTIARDVVSNGGFLTEADLADYEPVERRPITVDVGDWVVATNPPPAVGGATLGAVLLLAREGFADGEEWTRDLSSLLIDVQSAVFDYRRDHLERAPDGAAAKRLLDLAELGDHRALLSSPSTIHVSAADTDGTGCAITISAGYGSGAMIPGTGIWMNNCLGELELLPEPIEQMAPGTRLRSNMAPTVARRSDGSVLAVGSPGASRITSAIATVLLGFTELGLALHDAVDHPRLHVETFDGAATVACEPGIPIPKDPGGRAIRRFPDLSMYFGGVAAALWGPDTGLFAAADPRRSGGIARGGLA